MKVLDFAACGRELYEKRLEPISRQYGLTAMELNILLFLANNPEYDTATDIAERRYLTKSHISISIRSLEEKGLLRKEYRNGDHRTVHLVLLEGSGKITAEGQRVQAAYMAKLLEGFSDSEIQTMKSVLDRMGENICRALEEE